MRRHQRGRCCDCTARRGRNATAERPHAPLTPPWTRATARGRLHVAVVGPCAAGKTTLARSLQALGYYAHQIAQEHSYVPAMWQRLTKPDVLIYLDASYETCTGRKRLDWLPSEHAEQRNRLAHARLHCDIYVGTDALTPEQVLAAVLHALQDVMERPRQADGRQPPTPD